MTRHSRDYDDAVGGQFGHGKAHEASTSFPLPSSPASAAKTPGAANDAPPCRSCVDYKTWMRQAREKKPDADDNTHFSPTPDQLELLERESKQCPLDKDELGRSTWALLHTLSVNVPEKPSRQQQQDLKQFVTLFSRLYPCEPCAVEFREDLARNPVCVDTGSCFARWLCEAHNRVNRRLEKPTFDCSKLFERWRDGWKDGTCD